MGYFRNFAIFKEDLGHYTAYNKINGEFEVSGDTLKEVIFELLDTKDAE